MIDDINDVIEKEIYSFYKAFPEIKTLASSEDCRKCEDAATTLVEISKKREEDVIQEMIIWAGDNNPNIRRTASEGLGGARKNPKKYYP